jgi:predicted site-specific integrase-resolvase
MILTIDEAAEELGISTAGVRKLVERGELKPLRRKAKPSRFWLLDVAEAKARRMSRAEHDRLDALASLLTG